MLDTIPSSLRETSSLSITQCGKAFGLCWDTTSDSLFVITPQLSCDLPSTKRSVISVIAKTFDVMGWYALTLLPAKLLLQELWSLRQDWDDPIPDSLRDRWKQWLEEVSLISQHPISRHVGKSHSSVLQCSLHGFSDASTKVYGGVVYLRTVFQDSSVAIDLLAAKSRVAPVKLQTVPRLELCGANLLSELLSQVQDLSIPEGGFHFCLDRFFCCSWMAKDGLQPSQSFRLA